MSDLFKTIADRLGPLCPAMAEVRSATSAQEANDAVLGPVPIGLVIPAAERWSPVTEAGLMVTQSGRIAFSVVVALASAQGGEAWTQARRELRAALLGWTPADDEISGPAEASGARLLNFSSEHGGRWLHAFDFTLPSQATYGHQT